MNLLLDTHGFIFFIEDSPKLSDAARSLIEDEGNEIYLSLASIWEMAIKTSLGKLSLAIPFHEIFPHQLAANDIQLLSIEVEHAVAVATLPFYNPEHRDPFDRLIIAQSMVEGWPVVSTDRGFDAYPITRLWD